MNRIELILVGLPLIGLLLWVTVYEIWTTKILNVVVLPAAFYFLVAACIVGSKAWWQYLLGLLGMFSFFFFTNWLLSYLLEVDGILGGGAIKLLSVVGAALGVTMSFQVGGVFILSAGIVLFIGDVLFNVQSVPSPILVAFSALLVLFYNFGFQLINKSVRGGAMQCPTCGLYNPDTAIQCDCGHDFRIAMPPTAIHRPGIFLRLWNGEVSLPVVFWFYVFLIRLPFIVLYSFVTAYDKSAASAAEEQSMAFEILVMINSAISLFILLPYSVFIAVAIWRSASNYQGAKIWAILAKIYVILGIARSIQELGNALKH